MFGRRPKTPPNYKPKWEGGHGLWEIWYDHGPGTTAHPVRNLNVSGPHNGTEAFVFLYDDEAETHAHALASSYPDRRFAVKLRKK